MSVRKLKNGRWIADVVVGIKPDGTTDRRTKTCATKTEAERAERAMLARKDARLISGRVTIDEFIEDVFWPAKQHLRANTKRGYLRDIKLRILPAFSGRYIEDITHYDIQAMLLGCSSKKVATNARETLSSILGLACEMEMLPRNPAGARFRYPAPKEHSADHYGVWLSTFAEHQAFFSQLDQLEHEPMIDRMCVLGLCFGLRKGEIFGLDWENVDFSARTIYISQTYVAGMGSATIERPKTERSVRTIPITTYAYEHLLEWRQESGPIVTTKRGTRMHPHSGQGMMQRIVAKYPKLPNVTLHSMRHSFATSCINAGIEVAKVSAWLGHREVSTTYNRYVKPLLSDLQGEVSIIDAAFNAKKPIA